MEELNVWNRGRPCAVNFTPALGVVDIKRGDGTYACVRPHCPMASSKSPLYIHGSSIIFQAESDPTWWNSGVRMEEMVLCAQPCSAARLPTFASYRPPGARSSSAISASSMRAATRKKPSPDYKAMLLLPISACQPLYFQAGQRHLLMRSFPCPLRIPSIPRS